MRETTLKIPPEEFQQTIDEFERDGFRLLMIKPADAPREALLQKPDREGGLTVRVNSFFQSGNDKTTGDRLALPDGQATSDPVWSVGRAGMMYRDLIPDRLGGKLIASHIRIVDGGPVPDRVHYHKVVLQIIFCLKGAIRVVYEDQGPPFWLRPGDCVLQPPEIRHRVLEAEAGSEVIEITSPAEHETWFDHEMTLPNGTIQPSRLFGTQQFHRHRHENADFQLAEYDGIKLAGTEIPHVRTAISPAGTPDLIEASLFPAINCIVLIDGRGILVDLSEMPGK